MKAFSKVLACGLMATTALATAGVAQAQPNEKAQKVFDYWTSDRIAAAQPRDMVIDSRGKAYVRGKAGKLTPHGHTTPALAIEQKTVKAKKAKPEQRAKPPTDTTGPAISDLSPADGAEFSTGGSATFSAVVTDASGINSVTFNFDYNGQPYTFDGTFVGNDTWETTVTFNVSGSGTWNVSARDGAKRGGNTSTSGTNGFSVGGTVTPPPPPPSGTVVTNSRWTLDGDIQTSTGRLFYEMISARRGKRTTWSGYVCSGTVATDGTTGRSVIITAAHCVYNDQYKAFARNVLFIPNQDQTTGSGTDTNCSNDPVGCWTTSFGVVDENWTTRTFPQNIPWDYAYYTVNDSGSHSGSTADDSLETEVGGFTVQFTEPAHDDGQAGPASTDWTHNLGYSYSDDPFFMYSAMDMEEFDAVNWWQPTSGLSGGSSGGPWVQPMNETSGSGPIISVNSWGYSNGDPGMAGPKLNGTTAECVFDAAKSGDLNLADAADGEQGIIVDPATCP